MSNELLILGLLKTQPMHGYQLMERVQNVMSVCAELKRPTVYFLSGEDGEKRLGGFNERSRMANAQPEKYINHPGR